MNKKKQKEHLRKIAPSGGKAIVKKRGTAYMRKIARNGLKKRWAKRGDLSAL